MVSEIISQTRGFERQRRNSYQAKPIAEIIVNGFFTVDKKWTVQYWNKAAERILKVQAAEIIGKNLWEVFAGLLPLEFYAVYHKAFESNMPVHFEEYWGEMGGWFDVVTYYCDDTLSVSFKSSQHSIGLEYPTSLEQQLQIKTGLYKFITEVTNDCLWEWDLVSNEMFWIDGGHRRIFGYPIENALIPQSFWEGLIHPDDRSRVLSRLRDIIAEKSTCTWEDEYRFKKMDGDYAWVHDRGHIICEASEAQRMIGATLDITAKVLLEEKSVAEGQAREREIAALLLAAQEKERFTIGKELLDNINQVLAATNLYVSMAKEDEGNREAFLNKSSIYIIQAMTAINKMSKALAPPFIDLLGLVNSIKILTDDLAAGHLVRFTINDNGLDVPALNQNLQMDIFRIVQLQVHNILRYAFATTASIDISRQGNEIILLIADDGVGCDLTKRKNGNGLKNIVSRANLYRGSVTTLSTLGDGYTLQVIFRPDN